MTKNPSGPSRNINIAAQMRVAGMRSFQTSVRDLSISGFTAQAITRMHPGLMCWLTLPGLQALQAEVVWWDDGLCGCTFANPLNPVIFDAILDRHRGSGSPGR